MTFKTTATIASFGGKLLKLTHQASTTGCEMALNLYLPPQALTADNPPTKVPVLIYLSGLTCTGDNCAEKGFFQPHASKHGIAIVYSDTSPRGLNIPGEDEAYDFGTGAGFYIDATQAPWSTHYRMYSYVNDELPSQLFAHFPQLDSTRVSLTGHSMGGHGALTIYLRNPQKYCSASAFAPISNPIHAPWGRKAFEGYFGPWEQNSATWKEHDATELMRRWRRREGQGSTLRVLVDVGTGDNFYLQKQLLPENLVEAARSVGLDEDAVRLRFQPGYDHSYHFVSTFAGDHVEHAARYLFG